LKTIPLGVIWGTQVTVREKKMGGGRKQIGETKEKARENIPVGLLKDLRKKKKGKTK